MKDKLKNMFTVTHLNLFMVIVLACLVAYPLFAPIVPAVYNKPVVEDTSELFSGHTLTYKIHTCRRVSDGVLTTVTRKLVSTSDKNLTPITLGTDTFTNTPKCQDSTKTLIIPYSTPAGTYQLQVSGVYSVIPLRKPITVTATSDSFRVEAATTTQDIQALIDANTQLEQTLQELAQKSGTVVFPSNTTNSTTNNSTTNNTTNNNPPAQTGSGSDDNPGLLKGIINALGGGINLSL